MKREPLWRRYLRFWGPSPERDVDDEFAFHIEAKVEELIAAGRTEQDARREAERLFGPAGLVRQECYGIGRREEAKASRIEYWAGWGRDFRYAVRSLLKTKASTAAAVAILTLAIGANTAVFTLFDRLIYRPLPLAKPSELVLLWDSYTSRNGTRNEQASLTYPGYVYLRDHNQAFSGLAVSGGFRVTEQRGRERNENSAEASSVSGNYFEVLGVSVAAGRTLNPVDDVAGAAHVAVASDRFARSRYTSSAEAVGKTIYLKRVPFTIVGVLPEFFQGVSKAGTSDVYIPITAMAELYELNLPRDASRNGNVIGRLRPGMTRAMAQKSLQPIWQQYSATTVSARPDLFDPDPSTERLSVEDGSSGYAGISGEPKKSLQLLAAILALLLLMGCVNVGCLLMARTASRQQELAIRLSLGAGKTRILRQLLLESALISFTGGAGGLMLAFGAEKLILAGLRWGKDPIDLSLDGRVLAFSLAISLATGLMCGLAPAIQLLRGGRLVLNHERMARPVSSGRALVVVEVALSLVMVAGAAMFVRGLHNLRSVPLGFSAEGVAVIRLAAEDQDGPADHVAELERNVIRVAERLRGTPGIESVTVADTLPFGDGSIGWPVRSAPGQADKNATAVRIAPEYFDTMQIPVIAGRAFGGRDDLNAPKVAILSASLARSLFGEKNPIGETVRLLDAFAFDVIGVVGDVKFSSVRQPARAVIYLPISQPHAGGAFMGTTKLSIRTRIEPRNVAKLVNDRIASERLPLLVGGADTLENSIGASYFNDRVRMQATSAIGAIALLLIVAGIYGLMAYWVAQRTREIGVRVAIGSTSARIVRLVLRQSVRLIVIGVLLGVPGAVLAMRALSGMVFGLGPIDIASLVAAAVILLATGIAAAAVPAWRAARLDPLQALRVE